VIAGDKISSTARTTAAIGRRRRGRRRRKIEISFGFFFSFYLS